MFAAAVVLVAGQQIARAVELRIVDGIDRSMTVVEISGRFEPGDGQKVITFLGQLPRSRPIGVNLLSPGGSIEAGLEMGRYFHASRIATFVRGDSASCASSCALAFLGGRNQTGEAYRVKGWNARLGLHALSYFDVPDREFTVDDMKRAMAMSQNALLRITDYLVDVGADIEFMRLILSTPASEQTFMSNELAMSLGIHVFDEGTGRMLEPADKAARNLRTR